MSYLFRITDSAGNNPYDFTVTRYDYNWNSEIKTYAVVSTPTTGTRGNPTYFDFGRKIEGFVLYGIINGDYAEIITIRTLMNGAWWANRPVRLYIDSGSYHDGQVADFKCYNDRLLGADANIKFVLTFVVGQDFLKTIGLG